MQKTKKQENHVIKKYIPSDVIFFEIQNFLAYPLFSILRLINVFFQNYKWGVCLRKNPYISAIFARKSKSYMRYEISSKRSFKCDQPEYYSIRRLEMRAGRT